MRYGGQLHIADFELAGEDYTFAPTITQAPSIAPSSLVKDKVSYLIRYAGEVRTVVNTPFQIENTGEALPMDGTVSYRLCMVDEVEGSKGEFNRMNFWIDEKVCVIRFCPPRPGVTSTLTTHECKSVCVDSLREPNGT